MRPLSRDLYTMGRIVLWLLFSALMTPIAAVLLHAMARVLWGPDISE